MPTIKKKEKEKKELDTKNELKSNCTRLNALLKADLKLKLLLLRCFGILKWMN